MEEYIVSKFVGFIYIYIIKYTDKHNSKVKETHLYQTYVYKSRVKISINVNVRSRSVKLRRKSVGDKHVDDCEYVQPSRSHDRLSSLKHRLLEIS